MTIHASEIANFKKRLKAIGFKSEELCAFEQVRMRHPEQGVVIIYRRNTGNPFPRVNDNGYRMMCELLTAYKGAA